MATTTLIFMVLVGLAVVSVTLLLLWKLTRLALKLFLIGGLLLLLAAAATIVYLGNSR